MDTTIKVNLLNPASRLAMRALLTALDAEDAKAAEAEQGQATKPRGGAPGRPAAAGVTAPATQPSPAAPPSTAATPPADGDGEAMLTADQKAEVIRLQTERVKDTDQARTELKATLQKCFKVSSLSQLRQKWYEEIVTYAKTGKDPETVPF